MACVTKKKGKWAVDFYDQHGKRRLKMLPKGATKKQATVLLREIEEQVGKRTFMPTEQIPTFSNVAKDWIEYKKMSLRATTWECYEGHVRNHFDDLDELKINRITIATMEKFIRARQDRGMHINTLRKILVSLNQILAYAVRHRYIDYNPLRDTERPRETGNAEEGIEDEDMAILTPPQITLLLDNVDEQKYETLTRLAIFSGAREGELIGLKWSDVDWDKKQIHIKRTFTKGRFFPPKTKQSRRKIDIGPRTMKELKKWKLACPANDLDLVFPSGAGKPLNYSNMVQRHFHPALKTAGLKRIKFHNLRHTFASLKIEQGENIKYIQNQLGHSSPMVTLTVYAHLMKDSNPESARGLENMIFGESGDQMETTSKKVKKDDAANS